MTSQPADVALRTAPPASFAPPERAGRAVREPLREPSPARVVWSWVLTMISAVLALLLVNLVVVSQLENYVAQRHLYTAFRQNLAAGTVPVGQTGLSGALTPLGTPVAELRIPSIGVDDVVVEGSDSFQTMDGVGHRRDTPLPGQPGVSVLSGRAWAYGGVFKHLDRLAPGAAISVLTGQGTSTYRVIGVRTATTRLPVLGANDGRLTLATAAGSPFAPSGVTRVDAQLTSTAFPRPTPVFGAGELPATEQALAGDRSHAFALTWLVELLGLLCVAAVWVWLRWRRAATWVVFAPVLLVSGLAAATSVSGMLPNLL